jgi:hypothetical protein
MLVGNPAGHCRNGENRLVCCELLCDRCLFMRLQRDEKHSSLRWFLRWLFGSLTTILYRHRYCCCYFWLHDRRAHIKRNLNETLQPTNECRVRRTLLLRVWSWKRYKTREDREEKRKKASVTLHIVASYSLQPLVSGRCGR